MAAHGMTSRVPHDIVFVHQNMPGQFRFLATALAALPDKRVFFVTRRTGVTLPGVTAAVVAGHEVLESRTRAFRALAPRMTGLS